MGLDSYWRMKPTDDTVSDAQKITFNPPLNLCGGMFSGTGEGSFRGKVYAGFLLAATGVDIYEDWIGNDTIRAMADKLESPHDVNINDYDMSQQEGVDLLRMFRAYADAGFGLAGWW